jgi:probable HAF family extracellular repeat protein
MNRGLVICQNWKRSLLWTMLWTMVPSGGTAIAAENFISFDVPGAALTNAQGINDDGGVVGFYIDGAGKQHGFLVSGGKFTTIDYPGALATDAWGYQQPRRHRRHPYRCYGTAGRR